MTNRQQNMLSQKLSNRRLTVDLLALMFGLGAWIGVNGIYVQLPLLVNKAPEGWSLPAHMVMLVQFANLGPILYTLYIKYSKWACEKYIIYILLAAGAMSTIILAFVYDKTSVIFGNEHSTALLSLMFVTATVGCTSSVLFMPYMRNYREIYLVTYLVGEGLSGFVPSLVALIQGVGGNPECRNATTSKSTKVELVPYYPEPRFSSETFFIFIGVLFSLCYLAFLGLNTLSVAVGERVKHAGSMETLPTDTRAPPSYKTNSGWTMSKQVYSYLLVMMAIVCFLGNGTLPSIQSYSCLPYGNIAYHLTVTLSSMAGPLAMCLGFVIKIPKVNFLTSLMIIALVLSGFVFFLAVKSPAPPLQHSWVGEFLVVLSWILINGLIGFIKLGITTLFRPDPGRGLYYTGVATQIGSLIGAVVTFVLVNHTKLFQSYSPCSLIPAQ
ncbi:solute carrier family 52, riboflavin transporter, member 3-A-like [Osmia bicornis bicornis]|uniref:solute carrier family 52, riboflavin transporter, member 3-A-like n=1 Tax=Osmia bicornis bicornis TaxID=1437191 RepID=UPI0010F5DB15|nr:solute carrier family 52, riboflavin transporter, member 3-A-like [Osmia bicornis bicornis]XP_029036396.1 solute carrier family 52, riboflavin transporter, member 3-A-like [Osmia bicornis bicornis]XP_029036397.1 solute carrier family 52, riboflavin transporter, member 3-A-like [Osmia bicornis bicornis]